jgi:glyoxylase-like metal-dependent hydrolase (beta-lactamase superfamily II)
LDRHPLWGYTVSATARLTTVVPFCRRALRREWEAAADPDQIRCNAYNRADFDLGHQLQLIDGEYDPGDCSVVCLPTYEHTAGHQSLRVRTDSGEYVMTADSCYMRKVLEEMVLPTLAFSYDAMREVIERYRKMERAGVRLIFGHDAAPDLVLPALQLPNRSTKRP